ncbi:MAG: 4-hydroxythreonine-4-phosphate dehydrogenase PdxA [Candidatus Dadabacteria bacterium]|nr:4-hydroxythreonine-4-phosphate dehydrogenase PdxA [Candidatus Dadabacteria bacterium]NIQ14642.1 4-hydroxythreonine-4-phosphate dehydrogenase PdxA [Candidatus Dadabacteria bacterium]
MTSKPKIGITIGDPNGIGPEVAIKACLDESVINKCEIVFIGSKSVIDRANEEFGDKKALSVIDPTEFNIKDLTPGKVSISAGKASIKSIEIAVELALNGDIDAIVTAPISKESIHLAGSKYPGHTEMLKDLTNSEKAMMLFEGEFFKVALLTIHVSLKDVPGLIKRQTIYEAIKLCGKELKEKFDIDNPKIAVCALNPHAGEAGAFGNEEIKEIKPAIEKSRNEGINVEGPFPADTLFYFAKQKKWDLIIAMYHDQGLIPFKMLSFDRGVNVTIGIPVIRTSPDHGTAFNLAWKGVADPNSMIEAINTACKMINTKI